MVLFILAFAFLYGSLAVVPATYDLRTVYPACLAVSGNFTQGQCNACWAASSLGSLSDRFCAKSGGKTNTRFSVEEVVSCSVFGCTGFPTYAYDGWLSTILSTGVVTESCRPYTSGGTGNKEDCNQSQPCVDHSTVTLYGATSVYSVTPYLMKSETEEKIMEEIYSGGSVWARMKLSTLQWQQFSLYKPGTIWSCGSTISDDVVHVVKLVGWGTSGGTDFWIGWNPWGPKWGDGGYFLIQRIPNGVFHFGTCSIQSAVWAATPKI